MKTIDCNNEAKRERERDKVAVRIKKTSEKKKSKEWNKESWSGMQLEAH